MRGSYRCGPSGERVAVTVAAVVEGRKAERQAGRRAGEGRC
ncbi:hypothetical protein E2C01_097434 [Portunus trituberculatus]|uniref:Uncharacterized protein n=1 Tax=Portunus trituberculatus TaxID=210409 RepID=A0A5B7K4T8_PORTR|nr:hypothetical protein [Portunus trituberculatus]